MFVFGRSRSRDRRDHRSRSLDRRRDHRSRSRSKSRSRSHKKKKKHRSRSPPTRRLSDLVATAADPVSEEETSSPEQGMMRFLSIYLCLLICVSYGVCACQSAFQSACCACVRERVCVCVHNRVQPNISTHRAHACSVLRLPRRNLSESRQRLLERCLGASTCLSFTLSL